MHSFYTLLTNIMCIVVCNGVDNTLQTLDLTHLKNILCVCGGGGVQSEGEAKSIYV